MGWNPSEGKHPKGICKLYLETIKENCFKAVHERSELKSSLKAKNIKFSRRLESFVGYRLALTWRLNFETQAAQRQQQRGLHCQRLSMNFLHFNATRFKYLLVSIIRPTPDDDFYDDLFHNLSHLLIFSSRVSSLSRLTHISFTQRSFNECRISLLKANSNLFTPNYTLEKSWSKRRKGR